MPAGESPRDLVVLIELILVFGAVIGFCVYEYRKMSKDDDDEG